MCGLSFMGCTLIYKKYKFWNVITQNTGSYGSDKFDDCTNIWPESLKERWVGRMYIILVSRVQLTYTVYGMHLAVGQPWTHSSVVVHFRYPIAVDRELHWPRGNHAGIIPPIVIRIHCIAIMVYCKRLCGPVITQSIFTYVPSIL